MLLLEHSAFILTCGANKGFVVQRSPPFSGEHTAIRFAWVGHVARAFSRSSAPQSLTAHCSGRSRRLRLPSKPVVLHATAN